MRRKLHALRKPHSCTTLMCPLCQVNFPGLLVLPGHPVAISNVNATHPRLCWEIRCLNVDFLLRRTGRFGARQSGDPGWSREEGLFSSSDLSSESAEVLIL